MTDRVNFLVSWNLDPIPGANHTPEDAQAWLERMLKDCIGWYHPEVTPLPPFPFCGASFMGGAICILPEGHSSPHASGE